MLRKTNLGIHIIMAAISLGTGTLTRTVEAAPAPKKARFKGPTRTFAEGIYNPRLDARNNKGRLKRPVRPTRKNGDWHDQ